LVLNERIEQLSREISARRRAEEAVREQHELLRVTLASIGDAVITTDHEGRITFQNAISETLTGWTAAESQGRQLEEVFRIVNEQSGDTVENPVTEVIRSGQTVALANHTVLIAKDKTERPIDDSGAPIRDSQGNLRGVVLVYRDVSQRKEAEGRRESLLESERAARAEAERAGRMKDEFLATLSHELRTPLNAILGYATLLQMGGTTEAESSEWVDTIAKNARMQAQLIEDLLDMNRIISGKIRLDVQATDLPLIIEAAMETVRPSAEARGVRMRKIIDPLAGVVRGDPNRLQQIVWNLLSNAIKFTPKGGKIQVSLERVNSHVEISVADNGQGIAPDFLPHVFDRFRQADSSMTRHFGGLGLGLSIVKNLVELHGGAVCAKSPGEGHGSTFIVTLPLAVVHLEEQVEPRGALREREGSQFDCLPNLEGVAVLVVDDEPDASALVARMLSDCHANVHQAHSVGEAWVRLQANPYDVLVSDIGMPGQDGYELMRMVRTHKAIENLPALALTAFARSEDRRRAAMAGFQSHLAKPVEAMELLAVVASLAGRTGRS
jgi:PAS domain S-box-containing protein